MNKNFRKLHALVALRFLRIAQLNTVIIVDLVQTQTSFAGIDWPRDRVLWFTPTMHLCTRGLVFDGIAANTVWALELSALRAGAVLDPTVVHVQWLHEFYSTLSLCQF